mmetsp:Transcript_8249/g.30462  ORF Transcript_8249/g.30462 Transcript_8249/m.30462 type:complete len:125 (-) Transcript_8249:4084-4458(-)
MIAPESQFSNVMCKWGRHCGKFTAACGVTGHKRIQPPVTRVTISPFLFQSILSTSRIFISFSTCVAVHLALSALVQSFPFSHFSITLALVLIVLYSFYCKSILFRIFLVFQLEEDILFRRHEWL